MAMIYDLVTGQVTSDEEYTRKARPAEIPPPEKTGLQTMESGTPIDEMAPVDAYMVLLQNILKKL